jgi:hypothetical protein
MMKQLQLIIICLLISFTSLAQKNQPKTEKLAPQVDRWQYLMSLIDEEEKTINMARRKSDLLMYRLFELKSERIKLYKEKENKSFLDLSTKGKKISRKQAFKKTLYHYEVAKKFGFKILKKYPNTRYKAEIYYTLALNSRDYAYDNKELRYLRNALYFTPKGSTTWYLATVSLAEYYYNNKNYKKAVKTYDRVIYNKDDEWYTKNLYNYGWCLLKTHKFKQAINRLEEGYKLSFDKKYIDFRDQIMQSLVSFYVIGKDIQRGIKFIMDNDNKPFEALFRFAAKTSAKGFYPETEQIITLAEDNFDGKKEKEQLADLRLFQFDFYKNFQKSKKLYNISKELTQITLNQEQREEVIRKFSEKVRTEQIIIKKDFDKHSGSYDIAKLDLIKDFFKFLTIVDKPNTALYKFYTAETLYSVREYKDSLEAYKVALEIQLKSPSKEDIKRKSIDGIFSSIDFASFSKKQEKVELEYAYNKYLDIWPKDKKAQKIYPKLFALYLSDKKHNEIAQTLDAYNKNFPKDIKEQRKLYKTHLDLLIKDKKTLLLSYKIKDMQNGKFNFKRAEVKKTEVILANLLFNEFQGLRAKGEEKEALAGYKEVFFNRNYPKSVKAEASFNVGLIYTDLYDTARSLKWFKKSLPLFSRKEQLEKRVYLEKMAKRSALLQDFLNAAHIQRMVMDNFCDMKKENQNNFEQAIEFELANDYITKTLYTYDNYKKCTNVSNAIQVKILKHLFEFKHESDMLNFIDDNNLYNDHHELISYYLERNFWKYYQNDRSKEGTYKNYLQKVDKPKYTKLFKMIDKYEQLVIDVKRFSKSPLRMDPVFDGEKFNAQLNKRIKDIKPIIEQSKEILKFGNEKLTILGYNEVIKLLGHFSKEIRSYKPQKVGPDYPKNFHEIFKSQMQNVANNFDQERLEYKKSSYEYREKYDVLSSNLNETRPGFSILKDFDLRVPASFLANTYDMEK